jgi:hypothetical protein
MRKRETSFGTFADEEDGVLVRPEDPGTVGWHPA